MCGDYTGIIAKTQIPSPAGRRHQLDNPRLHRYNKIDVSGICKIYHGRSIMFLDPLRGGDRRMRQNRDDSRSIVAQPVVGTVRSTEDEPDVAKVGTVWSIRLSLLSVVFLPAQT
jgi:hypothetical protein